MQEKERDGAGTINCAAKLYEEDAVALLKKLVSCDTTDYHEKNGQVHVEGFFNSIGIQTERVYPDPGRLCKYDCFNTGHTYEDRYCLVGILKGSGGGRSLLLNAHMDTVFPASPEEWRTEPFTPVEKDDRIYGLGSADTKSGMAAMLTAMKLLKESGVRLKGDVIFEGVVDEEAGGGNGSLACIDAGYRADAVLVAEPTSLIPCSAHLGSYAFWLTVEGRSAHGNMKWKGISAFEKALPIIRALGELEKKWQRRTYDLLPSPVITVLQVSVGDGSITIPGECTLLVNYTYLPDGYDYWGEIQEVIAACTSSDEWFQEHPVKIVKHHDCGPYYTSPADEWPETIIKVMKESGYQDVEIHGMPCGADGRLYATVGKMPTVILGPGSIECAHKPNEYVEIDEYLEAVRIYKELICEWCGVAEED